MPLEERSLVETVTRAAGEASLDERRLSDWLRRHAPDVDVPVSARMLSAGRSNIIYELTGTDGRRYVLRRPPHGGTEARTHDVLREWKILQALEPTAVPTPPLVAMCETDDVIGTPFFVMEFVPAQPLNFQTARSLDETARKRLSRSLGGALHKLHSIDIEAVGLGSLHRERSVVERQVSGWQRRLDSLADLLSPAMYADMTDLGRRLVATQPESLPQTLVHGDFKSDNLMVDDSGQVVAVLDWELTTTGDPFVDLAWLMMWWGDDIYTGPWLFDPVNKDGRLCSGRDIADEYLKLSGADAAQLPFYLSFAYWRLTAINLVTRARFVSGAMAGKSLDLQRMAAQLQWQVQACRGYLDAIEAPRRNGMQ